MKPNPKIGRPRIHEVLTVPREIFKKLRDIADEARMPMQLVYEDALLNGIITLKDMYATAIEYRKTRDKLLNEPIGTVLKELEDEPETEQVRPAPNGDDDFEFTVTRRTEIATAEPSGDDPEQRGLLEVDVSGAELRTEYSGEPGE